MSDRNPHFDDLNKALLKAGWISSAIEDVESFKVDWTEYGSEKIHDLWVAIRDFDNADLSPESVALLRGIAILDARQGGIRE